VTDFLFVVLPGVRLPPEAGAKAEAHVKAECSGTVAHNRLSRFRVGVRPGPNETTLEPFLDRDCAATVVASLVRWAELRVRPVSMRLEGHRKNRPLPQLERRPGTVEDALAFRPHVRRTHHVQFVLGDRPEPAS
jgi:hypothetical protein